MHIPVPVAFMKPFGMWKQIVMNVQQWRFQMGIPGYACNLTIMGKPVRLANSYLVWNKTEVNF